MSMKEKCRLKPNQLTRICDADCFYFDSTADLEPLRGIIGQERAVDALDFGFRVNRKGYNIYIAGIGGTGRNSYAHSIADKMARTMKIPSDWVYVYNFKKPNKPKAISFDAGDAVYFKRDIENAMKQLKKELPLVFVSTEYEIKKNKIFKKFQHENKEIINNLNSIAKKFGFIFKDSEQGLVTIPLVDNRPLTQEEYEKLTEEQLSKLKELSEKLDFETLGAFNELREVEEKFNEYIRNLDAEIGRVSVNSALKNLIEKYRANSAVAEYIKDFEEDIVDNIDNFKKNKKKNVAQTLIPQAKPSESFFNRYNINLFIDNSDIKYAPIVNETNPTFYNILGAIEYKSEMGMLKTDFMQIKVGALHLANGGFLIINVKEILAQPFAWETLKRALKTEAINIENINTLTGNVVSSSLKPESIPLKLKVILVGDMNVFHALYNFDDDFNKLFKIMADFDVEMDRTEDSVYKMAQFIATHCEREELRHFSKTGVARLLEYSSRLADHQNKLSTRFNKIVEVLYEADAWAEIENKFIITEEEVEKAIQQKECRYNKYEEKLNEMIEDGTLLIDFEGKKTGQINGLAVMGTGEYSFGKPSRITVSTYRGKPGIISIEREIKKSGSIHAKGIMILSGYLGAKYAQEEPMSLAVSISFEQNYSTIDGDSASSTELFAILSSISGIAIKQYIAVTGSVNQKGEIQPIGGVNEKIEGFYDICYTKGLTGSQGVIIPKQNLKNLMLKKEVIKAVEENKFHIYAIEHVDEGIEILTDMPAGVKNQVDEYPKGTINYLVTEKLREIATNKSK